MVTNLEEINDMFLSKITDYRILAMTDEEIDETLLGYFKSARANFYKCKKSLKLQKDMENGVYIEDELSDFEIEIITSLMLVSHITPQLLSSENLKQSLSDKDFKIYSQANQLREVRLLLNSLESKSKKMITEYTFFDLEKERMS